MADVIPLVMDGSWHVPDSAPLADGCSQTVSYRPPNISVPETAGREMEHASLDGYLHPGKRAIWARARWGRRRIGEGRSSGCGWMVQSPPPPPEGEPVSGSVAASSLVGGRFW